MTEKKKTTVKEPPIEKPDVESTHTAHTSLVFMKNPQRTDWQLFGIVFLIGAIVGVILERITDGKKEKEKAV